MVHIRMRKQGMVVNTTLIKENYKLLIAIDYKTDIN